MADQQPYPANRYPYKPLPPFYIRILEVHPGSSNEPLKCNIRAQHIDSDQHYEAFSYVWGDPTPAAQIRCIDETDEGDIGIGKGLSKALLAFRFLDKTRHIWVDALCINQRDVAERQSQVRLMGAVYTNAKHVLCWLGPLSGAEAESTAVLAIDFLRTFNSSPHEHLQKARQHLHSGDDANMTVEDADLLKSWLAVKTLFDLEYFHRAWIIQEVGLAQHARFFWGTQDLWMEWGEVARFCRFLDDNGASVINHLGMKSWVCNHINLVWVTDSSGKPEHSFIEVLHWARVHRSTDPRDFVYALLSHPTAKVDGKLLVEPDYTITTAQAYTQLALRVIETMDTLEILAFVDHHEEPGVLDIPSWVPDWHALNLTAPLRCPTKAANENSDKSVSILESESGKILRCRGVFVDTLRAISDMIEPSGLIVTTLEKEKQKKIPFLIDHIWRETVIKPKIPLASIGELIVALGLVLTGGYWDTEDSTVGERQEQQSYDLAALIIEYERVQTDRDLDGLFVSLSTEEQELVRSMAIQGSAHQFVQDMTWTSMCRRVFRTAKGHFGLGPRTMKEGDMIVVVQGSKYPLILRRCGLYFRLVGPTLVNGFMNGEASLRCDGGVIFEQNYDIM
ncbi:uncharacterized protein RAG0_07413 [Rhynchosporium agropyri]|uniref:Heterokaryon incompatibility domain-containing protein n=1 Tax=Rhynchosporium agropyri TaxID=914238 RepID=A0A1E1KLI5_9HELO|nr:uncharacterized protein RAG0_07413 [Rhynchosporium agropyri]